MLKIENVKIEGFWHRVQAECGFTDQVNIIVGRNGSGKTTFMNILHAVLSVDMEGLSDNDFDAVTITLSDGQKHRTIKAKKIEDERLAFAMVEYQISQKKYRIRVVTSEDRRMALHYRRRALEESAGVREELRKLVSLSSLSVYRLRSGDEYEVRDRNGPRIVSPVDLRLSDLLQSLTHYQLELSQEARGVATNLQKEVLASILYGEDDAKGLGYGFNFDKDEEKTRLIAAFAQLNAIDASVRKKIDFHVNAISAALNDLEEASETASKPKRSAPIDVRSLEALRKTRRIIEMSLDAEEKTAELFSQINLFLKILESFITDKKFEFRAGDLAVSTTHGRIQPEKLSSGEKQLLILLIEALLQKRQPHIFLADEPELSLHISWQRMIIPAVLELNPNAQVIVATHSPEIASRYKHAIFNMEEVVNG